ncbi:hypothetical protein CDD80_2835 [Ophiocordyceps camponoti-rufipedis]|uniref:Uncharacterized protein n=1 Tax=Ophiocordyceps camponoti-rufipedis TaxID=2004952 RepID=A0A2C5Z526_9HYPO|nr:hypothetical protein CDD80_2835 [Ophiocordyceps camponoti-rufipedis]
MDKSFKGKAKALTIEESTGKDAEQDCPPSTNKTSKGKAKAPTIEESTGKDAEQDCPPPTDKTPKNKAKAAINEPTRKDDALDSSPLPIQPSNNEPETPTKPADAKEPSQPPIPEPSDAKAFWADEVEWDEIAREMKLDEPDDEGWTTMTSKKKTRKSDLEGESWSAERGPVAFEDGYYGFEACGIIASTDGDSGSETWRTIASTDGDSGSETLHSVSSPKDAGHPQAMGLDGGRLDSHVLYTISALDVLRYDSGSDGVGLDEGGFHPDSGSGSGAFDAEILSGFFGPGGGFDSKVFCSICDPQEIGFDEIVQITPGSDGIRIDSAVFQSLSRPEDVEFEEIVQSIFSSQGVKLDFRTTSTVSGSEGTGSDVKISAISPGLEEASRKALGTV